MPSRYKGIDGEMIAHDYLVGIGAQVIARNVSLAGAEIDLIAEIDGVYAFIEVKRRTSTRYGRPAEAVSPAKMRKIIRAASMYMAMHGLSDSPVRFDIIEILPGSINHIPSAFDGSMW